MSGYSKILIVEDDVATRTVVQGCVREEGYEVAIASDGTEALTVLKMFPADLILLDLMLPGMDGWDFRAAQKRDPVIASIPVIALSAMGRLVDADAFLRKPFSVSELLDAITRVWESRR